MMRRTTLLAAAALTALAAPAARAQVPDVLGLDFSRMDQGSDGRLDPWAGPRHGEIMRNVLNNPGSLAAYRAGVCGHGLTLERFAWVWAATGGCAPEGIGPARTSPGNPRRDWAGFWNGGPASGARPDEGGAAGGAEGGRHHRHR